MADIYSLTIKADTRDVTRARQALDGLSSGAIKAQRSTKQYESAAKSVARTSRVSSNGLRNTALQLSQVAQQGAATGNFMQALAIQLPDLALAFGPVGIAVGAVAGGLASYIFNLKDAEEETNDFIGRIESLEVAYADLNSEIRTLLELERAQRSEAFTRKIEEQEEKLRKAEQTQRAYNNALNAGGQAAARFAGGISPKEVEDAAEAADTAAGRVEILKLEQEQLNKRYEEYLTASGSAAASDVDRAKKLEDVISAVEDQAIAMNMNERVMALHTAAQNGATEADFKRINAIYDYIEAEQQRQEALKESQQQEQALQKMRAQSDPAFAEFNRYADQIDQIEEFNISAAEKEQLREEAFRQHQENMAGIAQSGADAVVQSQEQGLTMLSDTQQRTLGAIGDIFGNMAEIAEKGGKDQFNTWKALASAQAAVNTALAISNALAVPPPPVGIALASTIGALGAIQIAQIQQTEYQGARAMGGSVSGGGRYLVGENGPEVVTMGGSGVVTPSSVTNNSGTNQTIVMNVSGDVTAKTRQEIMKAIPMIRQQARQSVLQASQEGGAMSRAMGRRS